MGCGNGRKHQDGDSTGNVQGPQSKFLLGSWARLAGEERGPVWKSKEMVLGLHPDLGQPGLEGRSKSPKPVTHPEPLKRQQALCPCGKLTEECSQHHGKGSP